MLRYAQLSPEVSQDSDIHEMPAIKIVSFLGIYAYLIVEDKLFL